MKKTLETFRKLGKLSFETFLAYRFSVPSCTTEEETTLLCKRCVSFPKNYFLFSDFFFSISSKRGVLCFMENPGEIGVLYGKKINNQKAASAAVRMECPKFSWTGEATVPFSRVEAALKIFVISKLCFDRGYFVMETKDGIFIYLRNLFDISNEKTTVDALLLGLQVYADGRMIWTCTPQVFNMRRTSLSEIFTQPWFEDMYEQEGKIQYFGLKEEATTHVLPFFAEGNIIGMYKELPPEAPNFEEMSAKWLTNFGVPLPRRNEIGDFVEIRSEKHSEIESITFSPSCCLFDYRPSLNYYLTNRRDNLIFDNFFGILESFCGSIFCFEDSPEGIPPTQIAFSSSFSSASNLCNTKQMNIVKKEMRPSVPLDTSPDPKITLEEPPPSERLYVPNLSRRILAPPDHRVLHEKPLAQISFTKRTHSEAASYKRKREPNEKDASKAKAKRPSKDPMPKLPAQPKPATNSKSTKEKQGTEVIDRKVISQPTKKRESTAKKANEKKAPEKITISLEQVENGAIQKLKVSELKRFCQECGLRGLTKKKKGELIDMIATYLKEK